MSYLALYRKFRPATFDDVLGQRHILQTLSSQVMNSQIGHAYLFCGVRGTGKTTVARIFAKAVNCLAAVRGNPCGKCENCRHFNENNIDIIELDGASNNGVDEIRDIKEKVNYLPSVGKFKVYIIDEVHMLSSSAFNALLKTLEEPPAHIIFILCTTEIHKLPATVLSRCMRFDFRLIAAKELAALIEKVYKQVGKDASEEAVNAIAIAANGSARDALSMADRCLSGEGKLEYETVMDMLGNTDRESVRELLKCVFAGDNGKLLGIVNKLYSSGRGIETLADELAVLCRDLLILKSCGEDGEVLSVPKEELVKLRPLADLADERRLGHFLDQICKLEGQLRHSLNQRILLEATLVRLGFYKPGREDAEYGARQEEREAAAGLNEKTVLPS